MFSDRGRIFVLLGSSSCTEKSSPVIDAQVWYIVVKPCLGAMQVLWFGVIYGHVSWLIVFDFLDRGMRYEDVIGIVQFLREPRLD